MEFTTYLSAYQKQKDSLATITNTRIASSKLGVFGGSYAIPDSEYGAFLNKYSTDIVESGKAEYLTEVQLPSDGPCLVDLDFRFPFSVSERVYTKDHLDDLVGAYLEELTSMLQFDDSTHFNIYVFEKPAVNRVEEKQLTKDGIHLNIAISTERKMQIVLRNRMVKRLAEMWSDLPITNTWEEVLDAGIADGHTGWQLYGSGKPGHQTYELTYIYSVGYDSSDRQLTINCKSSEDPDWNPDWKTLIPKLSARCRTHPKFFFRGDFAKELDKIDLPRRSLLTPTNSAINIQMAPSTIAILNAQTLPEIQTIVEQFIDDRKISDSEQDWKIIEAYEYTMALPVSYYGEGSYDKWIRVGMALRSLDDSAFVIWVAFSAKSPSFDFNIDLLYTKWWKGFACGMAEGGLSTRSIMYWCRADAPTQYREIRFRFAETMLDRKTGSFEDIDLESKSEHLKNRGTTDSDLAEVLFHMFRDTYKCVSILNNIWYKYEEPRWIKIDSGVNLSMAISNELRALYTNAAMKYLNMRNQMNGEEDERKLKKLTKHIDNLLGVAAKLGSTAGKKNVMIQAKEKFYDPKFLEQLDANPYLLCFKNGVVDFKSKQFRRGTPEDYLTKCTNIDYTPFTSENETSELIRDFMRKLFPIASIHDYMWEHLASQLIGVLPDQTWNIYIGDGQNGKSMLIKLMEYVLGEYKGTMPINLLTDRRGKIGGAMPEIIALKALRMAVAQEPQKGDSINDGVIKQLTSGIDTIEGRGLYMAQSEVFYPQFKLVLCTNYLMEIKSNDHGTWRRIRVVPFKSLFTDEPVDNDPEKPFQFKIDRGLEERLTSWKEVFAGMLVNIAFKTQGKVVDCEDVMAASNAYRQSQDTIAEFIGDRTVLDPHGSMSKTELTVEYKAWYESTYGKKASNIKEVQAYMDKKFKKCPTRKVWLGVRIAYANSINASVSDDDIPEDDFH